MGGGGGALTMELQPTVYKTRRKRETKSIHGQIPYVSTCFICGRMRGCYKNRDRKDVRPNQREVTCFNCGIPGHISPDCKVKWNAEGWWVYG